MACTSSTLALVDLLMGQYHEVAENAYRPGAGAHVTTYTHDAIHRLKRADEGDSGSAPATFGTQDWSPTIGGSSKPLSQTGNWNGVKRTDPAWGFQSREISGTYNRANELLALEGTVAGSSVSAGGAMGAQIRYTAYGEPASFSIYDIAGGGSGLNAPDGNLDGDDYSAFLNAFAAEDALADMVGADGNAPGDGNVDGNDFSAFLNAYAASGPAYFSDNRRLYAGYELQNSMRKSAKECYASCADR